MAAFFPHIARWFWEAKTVIIPLPKPDAQTQPFWDACQEGRLICQRCTECHVVQFTPRARCMRCHSERLSWEASARQGTVMSFTRVHRAPNPAFKQKTPYVIAMLDMDEGFRLMTNASVAVQDSIGVGERVSVGFEQVEGMMLPIVQELT
ncbi:Zn-ribbon domain-containing OB-fold protein [Pollutimonas harenae]|nr:OB-fold domain-containing protein [Pollutimonas harenae]